MNESRILPRRHLVQAIALAAMLASGSAMAQAWPNKPVSLIVLFPAGGTTDVPTLEEAGVKGIQIGTWFGELAPAATPKDIVARLNTEMVKVIQSPDFKKRMDEIGAEPVGNTAEQMALQIKGETDKFAKLVKDAKVTIK